MSYQTIKAEPRHDGRVEWITLGPPPANIISTPLIGELSDALAAAAARDETGLIVITGGGKHFSYGASVEEHKPEHIDDVLPRLHALIGEMIECPVPTLAAASGLCLGGGFEVAMACSLIICDERAKFGLPEIKLGVFPPVGSVLLPWLVGTPAATRIIITGENTGAEEMHRLGAVVEVAPEGGLDEAVENFIKSNILEKSSAALRFANRAARAAVAAHYRGSIGATEKLYLGDLMSSEDAVEGITAFLEKRSPLWKNR